MQNVVRLHVTSRGEAVANAKIIQLSPQEVELGITDEDGLLTVWWEVGTPVVLQVVPYAGSWDGIFPVDDLPVPTDPSQAILVSLELEALPLDANPWWHPGGGNDQAGHGLRIGIVDTGSGPHPALDRIVLAGAWIRGVWGKGVEGYDCERHGTHVSGIIAARALENGAMCGLASAATTVSIRVASRSDNGKLRLTNGDIATAIDSLVNDHSVDLLNLSLGGEGFDSDENEALQFAIENGTLPLAAAGNHAHIHYPAAYEGVVAVGALGRWGEGSRHCREGFYVLEQERGDAPPPELFIPDFSLYEDPVDCFSAGVEIVSTVPEIAGFPAPYAAMTGSSMAVAVVTGLLARALGNDEVYPTLPRTKNRTDRARALLYGILRMRETLGGVERKVAIPERPA